MNMIKTISLTLLFIFSIMISPVVNAKDKEFKFFVSGYSSEKVDNQDDYAIYEASKYALKKGYEYFIVENIRRYDRAKQVKSGGRIGQRRSTKPKLRTEMIIHGYDAMPDVEGAYTSEIIKSEIEKKYVN
ncbi:MAG: hypothetical protein P8J14_01655 [Emcibacteraceae bacterium]|nr:hypothetical protein [Emcibacteraceae bacterium]